MRQWAVPVEQIGIDAAALAELLTAGNGERRVDHCAGWTVTDVVRHLGEVHRWATEIVRTGEPAAGFAPSPALAEDLGPWLEEGAATLVDRLLRTDVNRSCWTFGSSPGVAGFWRRRQISETAVHRADVELAAGLQPGMATEVAEMGIEEVVDFLYPRQVARARTAALAQAVQLSATESGRSWTVGDGVPTAMVTGEASDLLLMLWSRPHPNVSVEGEASAVAAIRAAALVP